VPRGADADQLSVRRVREEDTLTTRSKPPKVYAVIHDGDALQDERLRVIGVVAHEVALRELVTLHALRA
jgi:hypothetical protein